jgi:hypothetical protein
MTFITPTRRDGFIVYELEDETLVYNRERDEAHCLNRTAALVWKHYDGPRTVTEITALLEGELKTSIDERVVWLAISELQKKHLLTKSIARAASSRRVSRREMANIVARAALIALPVVTTLAVPPPSYAASCSPNCGVPPLAECCPTGCPCEDPAICCSGTCSSGSCT